MAGNNHPCSQQGKHLQYRVSGEENFSGNIPSSTSSNLRGASERVPGARLTGVAGLVAVTAALLLSACGVTNPFQSAEQADAVSDAANPVQAAGKRRNSTLKVKKGLQASSLEEVLEEPEYAVSIQQIMANATCRSCDEKPYHQMVVNASNRHGVPTSLIHAVIQKESGYKAGATSHRRARGLMQLTPETARFVGVSNSHHLYDPQTNIYAGTAYLKYLLASHDTVDEALAAYNSGPGNVRKYRGVPPFRETRRYVRDVKKLYVTTSR
jgi:soluble lytic murein transglycosylase-like protein